MSKLPVQDSQASLFADSELGKVAPERWAELKADALRCTKCDLWKSRTQVVFGSGNIDKPAICFIGEAPGYEEDKTGLPFVGASGKLLDKMIDAMKLRREDLYICNTVNCRPPSNREPEPNEALACNPYLVSQLRLVRPRTIVTLGATATHQLLAKKDPIGKLRGKWLDWHGTPLRATYHPAYLLRNPPAKKDVWDDLLHVQAKLKELQDSARAP